ncbi:MAG TPA: hypothetical protein VJW76_17030 [Verrucomicrobiae bacterium]|nr:hypothetical protein [Verrucomicrobiae bacterium]
MIRVHASLLLCLVCLASCDNRSKADVAFPHILPLESIFGIKWPTNSNSNVGGAWTYRAPLDGNSSNAVIVARLEIDQPSYRSWRSSVTNKLEEFTRWAPVRDPALLERFPWYDLHHHPASNVTHFFAKVDRRPAFSGKLEAFAVHTNGSYILYIQSWLLQH